MPDVYTEAHQLYDAQNQARQVKVRIEGLPELLKTLERLRVPPEDVEAVLWKGAKKLQTNIRANTPRGKTGNLVKGVVAKKTKGTAFFRSALTATDFYKAPHDHLVELGHRIVTRKGIDTGLFARPNAFFWPTVQRDFPGIGDEILKELGDMIEQRAK
jgi:hypothetical protein